MLIMDGINYDVVVRYGSIKRSFSLIEGKNTGKALDATEIRDLIGTGYTYSMTVEANPENPTSYDAFFHAISAPVNSHNIRLPYGQSWLVFDAKIVSGADILSGKRRGYNRWSGLTLSFQPMKPQRYST